MVQAMRSQFLAMQEAQEDEEDFGGAANEECVPLEAWIPADVSATVIWPIWPN